MEFKAIANRTTRNAARIHHFTFSKPQDNNVAQENSHLVPGRVLFSYMDVVIPLWP
jgi:hypothetical protein